MPSSTQKEIIQALNSNPEKWFDYASIMQALEQNTTYRYLMTACQALCFQGYAESTVEDHYILFKSTGKKIEEPLPVSYVRTPVSVLVRNRKAKLKELSDRKLIKFSKVSPAKERQKAIASLFLTNPQKHYSAKDINRIVFDKKLKESTVNYYLKKLPNLLQINGKHTSKKTFSLNINITI